MAYEIHALDLMDCEVEASFLVLARNLGVPTSAKIFAYLLRLRGGTVPGPEEPVAPRQAVAAAR